MRLRKTTLLSGTFLVLAGAAVPAFAQDAAPQQAEDNASSGLNDIIVTARKRQESVQDVPVAVTAMSEKMIQTRDITSIEKIAAATPNLNVGRASNGSAAQITLRGIGSSSTSIGIEQSVAVVVDGAYYGQGRVIEEGFFDLARVEVLKGPQALFFGKNATAGVISLTTNDPTDKLEGMIRGAYEFKANQYTIDGFVSAPITDTLGIRLAAKYSKMDGGYYRNVSTDMDYTTIDVATGGDPETLISTPVESPMPQQKELLARLTLKWEPTSDITNTLKITRDENDTLNNSWNYVAYACGLPSGQSQLTAYPCKKDFVTHQNNLPVELSRVSPYGRDDGAPYNRYRSWAVNNSLEFDFGSMKLNALTNYQTNINQWACACNFQTTDTNPGGMIFATENSKWTAWSQEMRLTSNFDGMFNFMIGGLYQGTKRDFGQWGYYGLVRNSAAPEGLVYAASEKVSGTKGETFAVFGQARVELMDNLEFAAGGRYTSETKKSFFVQDYVNPAFAAVYGTDLITANQKFHNFSPEATLTYKINPDVMVYAAYKTAYKSGGFSNGGINSNFSPNPKEDLVFNPEKARGGEIGIKSTLMDRQLRANLTAFRYTVKDFQVDFFNSPVFAFNTLTADARTQGVELELEFAPRAVPGLNINLGVNYNDAKYAKFPNGPCYSGQTQSEGCNLILDAGTGDYRPVVAGETGERQNLTGKALSVAPKWTGVIGLNYEADVSDGLMFGFNGNARYSDNYNPSAFANPLAAQKSYWSIDAGVRFGASDGNWQIALIGKNLTNQFYVTGVVDGPSSGTAAGGVTGIKADQLGFGTLPRTVKVELTKRF